MIPCDIPQTGRGGAVNMLRTFMVGNVDAPGWVDTQFYKNMDDIVKNITPTAEIIKVIKPIYNFKASETIDAWRKKL